MSSSRHEKDVPSRPKSAFDFRRPSRHRSSRDAFQPPKRSETPSVGQSSSSRRRHEEKGFSGRGSRKEKATRLAPVGEEEPDVDGGVSLSTQDAGYVPLDGYSDPPPDLNTQAPQDYTEEEARSYWTWDSESCNFYHLDEYTNQIIWAPRQFA